MTTVACYDCGRTAGHPAVRCTCGEPLWFEADASGFEWPDSDERSLWRYGDLLPDATPAGVAGAAGGSPLIRTGGLDEYAGCRTHVKYEAVHPTGTFKDRGSAVATAWIAEHGPDRVGTVSHGNMGMSVAAHAAAADLECAVLVPDDIPEARLTHIAQYGPTIVRVAGDYGRLYYDTLDLEDELGVAFVNSDVPLRVAGQKTVGLEICEAFAPEVPDAIALPTSSGGNASAIWKGLRELRAAGLIDDLPRLYLVQAARVDPIARAFREGRDEVAAVEPAETIAYSIGNPDPPSGNRALAAARDTGGAVTSVPEDAIREATRRLASVEGLSVEPASATSLAGVRELVAEGEIDPDEEVAMITTGTGFKEGEDVAVETEHVELASLAEELPRAFE